MHRQETCKKERKDPVTPPVVTSNTGLENQYLLPVESKHSGSVLSGHSTQQLLNIRMTGVGVCGIFIPDRVQAIPSGANRKVSNRLGWVALHLVGWGWYIRRVG